MKNIFKSKTFLLLAMGLILSSCTGIHKTRKDVETIIITGHEIRAKLLSDMLQHYSRQPVVVISSLQSREVYLQTAPPIKSSKKRRFNEIDYSKNYVESLPIDSTEFHNFVNFSHPKQVVFLGNSKYVPDYFIRAINPSVPTHILNDSDWKVIASQCEELFGISGLADEYAAHLDNLARGGSIDASNLSRPGDTEPRAIAP